MGGVFHLGMGVVSKKVLVLDHDHLQRLACLLMGLAVFVELLDLVVVVDGGADFLDGSQTNFRIEAVVVGDFDRDIDRHVECLLRNLVARLGLVG